jgi:hypothetical protein
MADIERKSATTNNHSNNPTTGGAEPPWVTIDQACEELQLARSTWDGWKAIGRTPEMVRLPSGKYRIRREVLNSWLQSLTERPETQS